MSQATDYVIANDTHVNVRADINAVYAAIVTMNSGSSAPSTTYAHMLWADTTTTPSIVSIRNQGDSAWNQLFTDTGLFRSEDGAAAAVAYGPASDIDTGWHFATAATITGVTAGVSRLTMAAALTQFNATAADTDFAVGATGGGANSLFVQGSDGFVGIGTGTPSNLLTVQRDGATAILISRADANATASVFIGRKSRGTHASPAALNSGDDILRILAAPYHSSGTPGFVSSGDIYFESDGVESGDTVPTAIVFRTMPSGGSLTERMRITSAGLVGIGKTPTTALLEVAGTTSPGILSEYHANNALPAIHTLRKSRGTVATPADVAANDIIGWNSYVGYYNGDWRAVGNVGVIAHAVSGSVVQGYTAITNTNTAGTSVQRYVVGDYVTLTDSVATTLFTMDCANNTCAGGVLNYFVESLDASNVVQAIVGQAYIAIVNTAGTVSVQVENVGTQANEVSSGTITAAVAASTANPSVISMNANPSTTSTLLRCIYSFENLSNQGITIT